MTLQYITDTNGKRKGVFLSMDDWNSVKKKLDNADGKLKQIEKRRAEILKNYKSSKKDKHTFSSDISQLKKMLK